MNKFWLILVVIVNSTTLFAQRPCGTMELYQEMLKKDTSLQTRLNGIEKNIQQYITDKYTNKNTFKTMGNVITLPVVFHVLYTNDAENVSDDLINEQLRILNEDFSLMNEDTVRIPGPFKKLAGNAKIQFALAQQNPNGFPTNGITRTKTNNNAFVRNNVKANSTGGKDAWDRSRYINIWLSPKVLDANNKELLGFAQFPGGPANTDGIVITSENFAEYGANIKYGARTLTHEMGHFLNLRHIWGDAQCGNDFVNDTPIHFEPNKGRPTFPKTNTCGVGPNGEMFMNYMDYTEDYAMLMFSIGQCDRMEAAINTARKSLITSPALNPPTPVTLENDSCVNATPLVMDKTENFVQGTVMFAKKEDIGYTNCPSDYIYDAKDVWFSFTATDSLAEIVVDPVDIYFDPVIELYDDCTANSPIKCIDTIMKGQTERLVVSNLVVGNTYFIRVYHYYPKLNSVEPEDSRFLIAVKSASNSYDDCTSSRTIIVKDNQWLYVSASLKNATETFPSSSCNGSTKSASARDVWFSFVATDTILIAAVLPTSKSLDLVVEAYENCITSQIACANDFKKWGLERITLRSLIIGKQYFIRVYAFETKKGENLKSFKDSDYDFEIAIRKVVTNDFCNTAQILNVDAYFNPVKATTSASTEPLTLNNQCHTSAEQSDVWFKILPGLSKKIYVYVDPIDKGFNPVVEVYAGCGQLNPVICSMPNNDKRNFFTINPKNIQLPDSTGYYYIRVFNNTTAKNQSRFNFNITVYDLTMADECKDAIPIIMNVECKSYLANVGESTQSLPPLDCNNFTSKVAKDIWFKFIATSTKTKFTISPRGNDFNPVFSLYSNCNTQPDFCIDGEGEGQAELINGTGFNIGQEYLIRVYHATNSSNASISSTWFDICVQSVPDNSGNFELTPIKYNDEVTNATTLYSSGNCNEYIDTLINVTQSKPAIACNTFTSNKADDVWYKFKAEASTHYITVEPLTNMDMVIEVFDSTGVNSIACMDSAGISGNETLILNNLVKHTNYSFRVYAFTDELTVIDGERLFNVCVTHQSTNDNPPVAYFTFKDFYRCVGEPVKTFNYSYGTPKGYKWLQSGNAIFPIDSINPEFVFNTPGTYGISLIADNTFGTDTAYQEITISPIPTLNVAVSKTAVCEGDTVTLSASGAYLYEWSYLNNQSTIITSEDSIIKNVPLTQTTTFSLYALSYFACEAQQDVIVPVYPIPVVVISKIGDTLYSSEQYGNQWFFEGNILTGETNPKLFVTQSGEYSLEVESIQGCKSQKVDYNYISTGINNNGGGEYKGKIYPNPTSGLFIIEQLNMQDQIVIENAIGQIVYNTTAMNTIQQIDIANFNNGLYIVKVIRPNGIFIAKINKQ